MLQLTGLAIAMYIFTRMLEMLLQRNSHGAVVACGVITMLLVLVAIAGLIIGDDTLQALLFFPTQIQ